MVADDAFAQVAAVPEPSVLLLIGLGLILLGLLRLRKPLF
ncbi:PEP-CTERM sorting domain-containing protein [Pseudoduganella sp. UC29_106]